MYKLKADNVILKANQEKLETAVQEQQELLEVKEMEYQFIIEKSKELEEKLDAARADNEELTKKFVKYDIETGVCKIQIEQQKQLTMLLQM